MAPFNWKHWITDPEYTDFLNYLIEQTKNVEAPMNALRMAREFKEKNGAAQKETTLNDRIYKLRKIIHKFEHIDMNTKVKMMFALSAPVNADFSKKLKEDAFVEVDDKQRITHYKSNDGSLELRGEHSSLAKNIAVQLESKRSIRSWIIDYFEKKNDSNAVPKNDEEKEMWNLIEFITEKCENINSPLNIQQLVKDFKNHFGISKQIGSIEKRVRGYCREIQKVEFLDTPSKVKQLFGLSATLDPDYLEKLRKEALVDVDEKNRIVHYKANDGSLELRGDHSHSAKMKIAMRETESKRNCRKWIIEYFENKNDSTSVPKDVEKKEMWNFIEFITEKYDDVNSPLTMRQLTTDFNNHCGLSGSLDCFYKRVKGYCREIQTLEFLDTPPKVKQLFCLSATLDSSFLTELRKDALVKVDEKNRIVHYKANDGSLELRGDHSQSKRNYRNMIIGYFEYKNDADAVSKNEEEREMWNFIEFITEKCENVNTPLNLRQLTKDFNNHFGIVRSFYCISNRVKAYCLEIQTLEFLDTHSKVKQLFGLGASLESNFLKELRKDAVVEVDNLKRITKYTANDGRLPLQGEHSHSAKSKLGWIERKKKRNAVKSYCSFEDDYEDKSGDEIVHSEDDSDEYSGEEFDFEDDIDYLDESEDLIEPSNEVYDHYNENPSRIHSPTEMSIDNNFDFDPPTENSQRSEETEMREDDGRKRKNSFPTTSASGNKRNKGATGVSSSNWTGSFSNNSMRPNELDDYKTNYSIDDKVKSEPVFGSTQEDLKGIEEDQDIQQVQKPPQNLDEYNQIGEISIKIEVEEPIEVKPETSHNSKIKFFEAMQSLIVCLDTSSLSWIQSKIHQKIQKLGGPNEVILNNEIVVFIELLISQISNHSVENLSKNVESVNLSNFLCYLKAAILNSKMSGVEGLVKNISVFIEKSQNKRIPMEKVGNALLVTLDLDGF